MRAFFNLSGQWVILNNETDFINGFKVSEFARLLSTPKDKGGFGYKLDNSVITVQYNQIKYCTDFSNLLFKGLEE